MGHEIDSCAAQRLRMQKARLPLYGGMDAAVANPCLLSYPSISNPSLSYPFLAAAQRRWDNALTSPAVMNPGPSQKRKAARHLH